MRLIDTWTFALEEFDEDAIANYAILSHTWEEEEVTFADMKLLDFAREKKGFTKIARAAELAVDEGLRWVWIDTCCIDKSSSAELQEAINSMWRWYSNATVCYVFMSDLPRNMPYLTDDGAYRHPNNKRTLSVEAPEYDAMFEKFTGARWFSRGWCLQELIAPKSVRFYTVRPNGGKSRLIGDRSLLLKTISKVTKVDPAILDHKLPLTARSVAQRMAWASGRETRRVEDQAYCLLGIFDVSMPMLYGEGKRAFTRLQEEIMKNNSDHSLFAWGRHNELSDGSLLASSPAAFADASHIVQWGQLQSFAMTNRGLRISLPLLSKDTAQSLHDLAILNCRYSDSFEHTLALRLDKPAGANRYHVAVATAPNPVVPATSPKAGRLALIYAADAKLATKHEITIARHFEPRSSNVRFMVYPDPTRAHRTRDYICETFSEQSTVETSAPVFLTTRKSVARAGIMLRYPSGRQISLVFGFDRFPPDDLNGVLLPGIWARFHRGPQQLKDIIKIAPIHAHGRASTCQNPLTNGCPYMPTTAGVSLHPEGDVLEASIKHELIFDEDVFVVHANIKQEHELDATETEREAKGTAETVLGSPDKTIFESKPLSTDTVSNAAMTTDSLGSPRGSYVPEVRKSVLKRPRRNNPATGPPDSTRLAATIARPLTSDEEPSEPSASKMEWTPYFPQVQAMPAFRDLHISVENVEPKLWNPARFEEHAGWLADERKWDSQSRVPTCNGSADEKAHDTLATDVQDGAGGADGIEDIRIE